MDRIESGALKRDIDWELSSRFAADIGQWSDRFVEIQEVVVSHDGEKVAAIVKPDEETFTVCVNGVPSVYS